MEQRRISRCFNVCETLEQKSFHFLFHLVTFTSHLVMTSNSFPLVLPNPEGNKAFTPPRKSRELETEVSDSVLDDVLNNTTTGMDTTDGSTLLEKEVHHAQEMVNDLQLNSPQTMEILADEVIRQEQQDGSTAEVEMEIAPLAQPEVLREPIPVQSASTKKFKPKRNKFTQLGPDQKYTGDTAQAWKDKKSGPQRHWILRFSEENYWEKSYYSNLKSKLEACNDVQFAAIEDKVGRDEKPYAEVYVCTKKDKKLRPWYLCDRNRLDLPMTVHIRASLQADAMHAYESIQLKRGEHHRLENEIPIRVGKFPKDSPCAEPQDMDVAIKMMRDEGVHYTTVMEMLPRLLSRKEELRKMWGEITGVGAVILKHTKDEFIPTRDWGNRVEWEAIPDPNNEGQPLLNEDGSIKRFDPLPFCDDDGWLRLDKLEKAGRPVCLVLNGNPGLGKTFMLMVLMSMIGPTYLMKHMNDIQGFCEGKYIGFIADEFTRIQQRCPVSLHMIKLMTDPDKKYIDYKNGGMSLPGKVLCCISSNSGDPFGFLWNPAPDNADRVAVETRTVQCRVLGPFWRNPLPPPVRLPDLNYRPLDRETTFHEEIARMEEEESQRYGSLNPAQRDADHFTLLPAIPKKTSGPAVKTTKQLVPPVDRTTRMPFTTNTPAPAVKTSTIVGQKNKTPPVSKKTPPQAQKKQKVVMLEDDPNHIPDSEWEIQNTPPVVSSQPEKDLGNLGIDQVD